MTKLRRRLLFYALVCVFLLLAGWLILSALGFSFDLKNPTSWRFDISLNEQGAIFVRATPAGATLYVNGIRYDAPTGIVRTQAFITNLNAGPQRLAVVKDGYHRWQKVLPVSGLEVTNVSTIRLFPRAPRIEPMASNQSSVANNQLPAISAAERTRRQLPETASSTLFSLELHPPTYNLQPTTYNLVYRDLIASPDEKKVLVRTARELWVIWLQKERVNAVHQPGQTEQIASFAENITDALWPPADSHHVIFAVGGKIKIAETDGRGGRNTVDLLEAQNVRFFLDPQTQKLLFTDGDNIFGLTL